MAQIGVPLRFFQSLFRAVDIGADGIVNITGTDGLLIGRQSFAEADIGHAEVDPAMFRDLVRNPGSSHQVSSDIDRIVRIYSARRVANLPLVVSVGVSAAEVYAEWTTKTIIIGGGLLLISYLGICLAWLLRRELRSHPS